MQDFFTEQLLNWHSSHARHLPWKADRDPYKVWLSEIILQQTQVERGKLYFQKLLQHFPNLEALAQAPLSQLLKAWEGLGYYSRARNLHKAAQIICRDHAGQFPTTAKELQQLPGIGPYSSAAIASFAFDEDIALVDANVYRVLARFFDLHLPIDKAQGKRFFAQRAQELLPRGQAARYNQAIMDFGALVCKPQLPRCSACPLASRCQGKAAQSLEELPRKAAKAPRRARFFHYLIATDTQGQLILQQRQGKDIWQDLYEFPLYEASNAQELPQFASQLPQAAQCTKSQPYKQILSHQVIHAHFWEAPNCSKRKLQVGHYALPRIILDYLQAREQKLFS